MIKIKEIINPTNTNITSLKFRNKNNFLKIFLSIIKAPIIDKKLIIRAGIIKFSMLNKNIINELTSKEP